MRTKKNRNRNVNININFFSGNSIDLDPKVISVLAGILFLALVISNPSPDVLMAFRFFLSLAQNF